MSESPAQALPQWNALKHGLRSAAVLLPDDDAEEFRRLRHDLFLTYRPRTQDEAACVESMASLHWRIARCRRWQAVYDAQTDALLTGDPNGLAGHICEPDPHRWMHKSMDCTLQEGRLDRLLCRARDKLLLLQKLRRNHLIAGAVEREPIFWPSNSPMEESVSPPQGGGLGGNGATSSCDDGEIEKYGERAEGTRKPTPALRATSPCKQGEGSESATLAVGRDCKVVGEVRNDRETMWK